MTEVIHKGDWYKTDFCLPPEGEIVETKTHDDKGIRNEYRLKRIGGFWVFPSDGVYVYYTPTHWRHL